MGRDTARSRSCQTQVGRDGLGPDASAGRASQLLRADESTAAPARRRGVEQSYELGHGDHSFELERHSRIAPVRVVPGRCLDQKGQGGGTRAADGAGQLIATGGPPLAASPASAERVPRLAAAPAHAAKTGAPSEIAGAAAESNRGPPAVLRPWRSGTALQEREHEVSPGVLSCHGLTAARLQMVEEVGRPSGQCVQQTPKPGAADGGRSHLGTNGRRPHCMATRSSVP